MPLESDLLTRLATLSFHTRRPRRGQVQGERRSTKRGTSVEFADYREYAHGDDLRRVDWNIYARLERPFVKLFEEEEDLAVHVLLDGSGSMGWEGDEKGREPRDKWEYARRLAAALGYVALVGGDRLRVALLRGGEVASTFGPVRGRGNALRLFEWLEGLEAEGTTDLNGALRAYGFAGGRAGLTVVISDLFSPTGYVGGLTALAARGHEIALLHLLTPDEVDPPLTGDLRLVDVETGETQEVTVDGGVRNLYRRRLAAWREEIRAACRARDGLYVPLTTDIPIDRALLHDLRRVRLLR